DEITKRDGKAVAVKGNVAKKADVEKLFADAEKVFGKIDILVNNAGVYQFAPLEEITEEEFHREFNTNVLGMLLATQEALRHFNSDGGSIINIGSLASSLTPPTAVVYNATKGAVDAITRTLAKELGPRKIRVNSINPGMVVTEGAIAGGYTEGDMRKMFEAQKTLGRVGETEDIPPTVPRPLGLRRVPAAFHRCTPCPRAASPEGWDIRGNAIRHLECVRIGRLGFASLRLIQMGSRLPVRVHTLRQPSDNPVTVIVS